MQLKMAIADEKYSLLQAKLLKDKALWSDPDFPADDSALGNLPDLAGKVVWKRIKDINKKAEFVVNGADRFDIEQGSLGDCWLLAVVASISCYPVLFNHVVLQDQTSPQARDYVGIFRARFWRYGQWIEVMVDDRLPVQKRNSELIFMHSRTKNEFWSALLEKAYAKLNGCYSNLNGGLQSEAMEDCTGGLAETISLREGQRPDDLLRIMQLSFKRSVLMGCCVAVNYKNKLQHLVRCRNPWGDANEWRGPWSDGSKEWAEVTKAEQTQLQVKFNNDGEFWMPLEEFVKCFTDLEICHLGLESLESNDEVRGRRRLQEVVHRGEWRKNLSAGGCANNALTFPTNPQYVIEVTDPDPDDNEKFCNVIVGLMQKDVRRLKGADFYAIGFSVYANVRMKNSQCIVLGASIRLSGLIFIQIPKEHNGCLGRAFLMCNKAVVNSKFTNTREVTERLKLFPGKYVIIPSTFQPNQEAEFILRIVTQKAVQQDELDFTNKQKIPAQEVSVNAKLEAAVNNDEQWLKQRFEQLSKDSNGAINAIKLRQLLNESTLKNIPKFEPLSLEVCRTIVSAMDVNHTGLMELSELVEFWRSCEVWKQAFLKSDENRSGQLSSAELRDALASAGFQISNLVFGPIVQRYTQPDTGNASFEDFIHCCVRLKAAFELFKAQPKNFCEEATFNLEDVGTRI
ncbi:hypothetical protein P879_04474 [Paragonimus westermani]|uniref:Calpain, invertebrate n=1 Tax=Paragonimus westermani TaxID=34504 RepID=A0A8T0DH00_9TREM|nr:hypothetical protein P879_04474 [Paragonimus westermani]